jgi:hypothetical protein
LFLWFNLLCQVILFLTIVPPIVDGRLSKDVVLLVGPDDSGAFPAMDAPSEDSVLCGLFSRLEPIISPCARFVLPARTLLVFLYRVFWLAF